MKNSSSSDARIKPRFQTTKGVLSSLTTENKLNFD